nr:uncharacterized protein CTRU02_03663 [Colletotrichum truncatum]KAF6796685.1 hypothetical protein CTRU02_03663 [Colletotrichum truncatum]
MRTSSFFTVIIASLATMVMATPTPQGNDCVSGYICFQRNSDGRCTICKPSGGS